MSALTDETVMDTTLTTVDIARELVAARKVVALVRRWTTDHPAPCWCLLCNSIRRFDEETQ